MRDRFGTAETILKYNINFKQERRDFVERKLFSTALI